MDRQDLDRLAYTGEEPPEELGYAETLYYLMLRALYQFAKATDMDPERGRREKLKIEFACKKYLSDQNYVQKIAERNIVTEAALTAYRKARNSFQAEFADDDQDPVPVAIRAADRLVEALDGVAVRREG